MSDDKPTPGKLRLVLVTHEEKLLELECDEVSLPGRLGYFGILPSHMPLLSTLKVGELMYRIGKIEHYMALSWGFAEVADDVVTVLCEFAEAPADIDVEAAEREAAEARAELASGDTEGVKVAMAKLDAAAARIQVASRR